MRGCVVVFVACSAVAVVLFLLSTHFHRVHSLIDCNVRVRWFLEWARRTDCSENRVTRADCFNVAKRVCVATVDANRLLASVCASVRACVVASINGASAQHKCVRSSPGSRDMSESVTVKIVASVGHASALRTLSATLDDARAFASATVPYTSTTQSFVCDGGNLSSLFAAEVALVRTFRA